MEQVVDKYSRHRLKGGFDETKCRPVYFHNGKAYFLPIISLYQVNTPVFHDDGTVTVETRHQDEDYARLLDNLGEIIATYDRGDKSIVFATDEIYADFFNLVRKLLLENYTFSNEELAAILTCSHVQLR